MSLNGTCILEIQPREHHPCHPKEDDVKACDQYGRWIILLQRLGIFLLTKCGKCPQRRTKPSIQNIFILRQCNIICTVDGASEPPPHHVPRTHSLLHRTMRVFDVLSPKLPRNTPVLNVSHPSIICILPRLGNKFVRPVSIASIAGAANPSMRTNHCVDSIGSTGTPERWERGRAITCSLLPLSSPIQPFSLPQFVHQIYRAPVCHSSSFNVPSTFSMLIISKS